MKLPVILAGSWLPGCWPHAAVALLLGTLAPLLPQTVKNCHKLSQTVLLVVRLATLAEVANHHKTKS